MAVVVLAFSSCKKNVNQEQAGIRFSGSTEAFVVEDGENRAYVGVNGGDSWFEKDDQIMVWNVNSEEPQKTNYGIYWTLNAGTDVPWKYSSGTVINHTGKEDRILAFYPAEIVNNARLWDGDNEVMFEIVDHQTYRKIGNSVVLPKLTLGMAADENITELVDDVHFHFKNIMGVLRLDMKSASGKTVTSIVYEDKVFNVTGRVHLKIDKVDTEVLTNLLNNYDPTNATYMASLADYIAESGYYVDDAHVAMKGKTITLDCGDGVTLNANTPQTFLITLRPLAAWGGFDITVNFSDGTHAQFGTTANNVIKPNRMRQIPVNNVDLYLQ